MSLNSATAIATGGLANINAQFALISQNVANAATPGYAVEVSTQQSITADGVGLGVHTGPATLQIDQALQFSMTQQNAVVAGGQTTQRALQAIDAVLGTPGAGNDLGSLLGNLQNGFSTLLTDPSSQAQQSAVVSSATTLAQGINALSATYGAQRQAAQDNIGAGLTTLNATLATIGQLSNQIIGLKPTDQGTADLENQRNAAVQTLSQLLDVKTIAQPDGDLSIFTASGLTLPTRQGASAFTMSSASTSPQSYYPTGIPGIMLGGVDVTNQMAGGQIGANVALRDTTLPTDQAELDEFAYGLSSRFDAQGLTLFTKPDGSMPTGGGTPTQVGYIGYAGVIQVNPTVTETPASVRDGTPDASGVTLNPVGGPAGFTALISRVLNYTFGTGLQSGAPQPALNINGLGPSGKLAAPFNPGMSLKDFATNLVSSQAQQSAITTNSLTTEQALQTSLQTKVSAVSGVNMDTEMSLMLTLQSAYSANARVISAAQSMFTQLLQAVQ
jgi:flagellar hook-associated protein 1 FlgK